MNAESLLPVLGELLAKSIAILLFAALLIRVWRGATAAQRHLVWFAAIVTVLLLPMTRLVTPRWAVPLERKAKIGLPAICLPPVSTMASEPPVYSAAPSPRPAPWKLPDWRKIFLSAWLGGAAFLFGYRLLGSWQLRRLQRRSVPLDDARIQSLAAHVLRDLKIGGDVQIRVSQECRVPMTWGGLHPVLMLPAEALTWNDTRTTAALRHEAGHIRRRDYLARWFAHLACALYWPNPFIWLTARALRVAQEQATDDLVLRAGTPADEYATQLFDAAQTVGARGFFAHHAMAMASPSTLEARVRAILDEERARLPLSRFAIIVGSTTVAFTLAICTAAQLRGADQAPPAAVEDPGAPTSTPPHEPQVLISAKFVELSPEAVRSDRLLSDHNHIYSPSDFRAIVEKLNNTKGVDLLSSPSISTRSKQKGTIEVVREFRYPTDWEKDPAGEGWKAKSTATKNVGVTLSVDPDIQPDGSLRLHLKPNVVDFLGFVDQDSSTTLPGKSHVSEDSAGHSTVAIPEIPDAFRGQRIKPSFFEEQIDREVTLKSGETVALHSPDKANASATGTPARELIVFVTATVIEPKEVLEKKLQHLSLDQQRLRVALLEHQSDLLKLLRPDQIREALRVLNINDPTAARNLPLLQDAIAEKMRLTNEDATANAPRIKELDTQIDTYSKILNEQLAGIRQVLANKVRLEKDKLSVLQKTTATSKKMTAGEKAAAIIIPSVELREATLSESVDFLSKKSRELSPDGTGVNFVLHLRHKGEGPIITLSLKNVPLLEAAKYVASLANLALGIQPNALVIGPAASAGAVSKEASNPMITREWKLPPGVITVTPPDASKTGKDDPLIAPKSAVDWLTANGIVFPPPASAIYLARPGRLIVRNTQDQLDLVDHLVDQVSANAPPANPPAEATSAAPPAPVSPLLAKASAIIIPKIEFKEATVAEVLDFLRTKAAQLDPQKTGVNIVCPPGASEDARLTLILTDIPLIEALRYVAGLANLTLRMGENAVLLSPADVSKAGPASATPVSITLATKKTFKDGDGIEIRSVSGNSATFRVGGTYRVQGVCRQNTFSNASLQLGNTTESGAKAIQPAEGASLSRTVPKGSTAFEFTFTPLRPGKLHVTIYDLDNHDPKDNAYAGLELGEVAP